MLRALRLLSPVLALLDVAVVLASLHLAEELRQHLSFGVPISAGESWLTDRIRLATALIWLVCFYAMGAHQAWRLARGKSLRRVLLANVVGVFFLLATLFFLKVYDFSRLLVAYFVVTSTLLLTLRQAASRLFLRRLVRPFAPRVLLVCGGDLGGEVADRLRAMPWGMRLVGVVTAGDVQEELPGVERLGSVDEVPAIIARHAIDEVMIALPAEQHALAERLVGELDASPVRIHLVPDVLDLAMVRATVVDFLGIPVVGLREPPLDDVGRFVKRVFDLAAGGLLTLLTAPVMLLCAAAIKAYDGGPVFFRQRRVGENGTSFDMLKFRSMVVDAEARLAALGIDRAKLDRDNPAFKLKNDPRITPVGRFLRRWSLDELPQLLNVLKGDMSLVGPRPEEAAVVAQYSHYFRKRLAVKPGITGPMQVNGRGDLSVRQRLKLEMAYIETWSLWSDVKILAKTIPVVLTGKGAY